MASEEQQIQAIVAELENVASRVVSKIVLDATANLSATTPRDTGWAAANWLPSISAPAPAPAGSRDSVSFAAQNAGAAAVAGGYHINKGPAYITNNVPYVPRLNDGTSRKAPAGFVQAAIVKALTVDIRGLET